MFFRTIKSLATVRISLTKPIPPSRPLSAFAQIANDIVANKEIASATVGTLAYLGKFFYAKQKASSKRLIFIVWQTQKGLPDGFTKLVKEANIDSQDSEGNTALHYACGNGNAELVRALLALGANPLKNNRGETPLYIAAFLGHTKVVDIFLNVATQYKQRWMFSSQISIEEIINQRTKKGSTALEAAVFNDHTEVAMKLFTHYGDLRVENHKGETLLFWAAMNNNPLLMQHMLFNSNLPQETIDFLMEKDSLHQRGTPLCLAAEKGYIEIAKLLIRRGAKNKPAGRYRQTPLHIALLNLNIEMIELLGNASEAYQYRTSDGWSVLDYAIHSALAHGLENCLRKIIVNFLSKNGISLLDKAKLSKLPEFEITLTVQEMDVADDAMALYLLAIADKPEAMKSLLKSKPYLANHKNKFGYSAIHDAILYGNLGTLKALVESDVDMESTRSDGSSPLGTATFFKQTQIALYLIEQGANIHHVNKWGESPLHYAIMNNDLDLTTAFCEKGIDLRHMDAHCYSYMHIVAQYGTAGMARLLLNHGALRDPRTENFKNLPIHLAVIYENIEVLKVLLFEYGADPDARNGHNLKPDQLTKNPKILQLLHAPRTTKGHSENFVALNENNSSWTP